MAVAARNAEGHGWLRPALGVMELSQSITQVLIVLDLLVAIAFCIITLPVASMWRLCSVLEFKKAQAIPPLFSKFCKAVY